MKKQVFKNGPRIIVTVIGCEEGIKQTHMEFNSKDTFEVYLTGFFTRELEAKVLGWMSAYSEKKIPAESIPLVWDKIPSFTQTVLKFLQKINFGSYASYQDVAGFVGNPKAARAVGNACARNPFPLLVPCHRVLTSDNKIGGFSQGLDLKKLLLDFEGISENFEKQ